MRIAVTTEGDNLESRVDARFGRAKSFLVYDTDSDEFNLHDNQQNLNAPQGAGIQSASNIADLGVEAVITGNVGPNAFKTLQAAGIKIYLVSGEMTVKQAIAAYKAGELEAVTQANVEGHWV